MPFLLILGLADFASGFTVRAVDPMLNVVAGDLRVSVQTAALLASAFALPYAAMQLVFGPIGDAFGRVRLIRVTLSLLTVGHIASALAPTHDMLLLARVFAGGWAGGIIPVALATVGDRVPFDRRPEALGRLLLAVVLGQLSGATISGVIAAYFGWRAVFWTGAGVSAVAALGAMLFLTEIGTRQTLSVKSALAGYATVLRNPLSLRLFAVTAIEGGVIFGVFPFVAPLLVEFRFGNAVEAGIAIGAFAIGGVGYSFVVRQLVRVLGLGPMAAVGASVVGLCLIGVAFAPSLPVVVGLFLILGFGFYTIHNTLQILATELSATARGSGISLYATSFFTGQALGAVVAGLVVTALGSNAGLFVGAGIAMLALAWPASRLAPFAARLKLKAETAAQAQAAPDPVEHV